MVKACDFFVVLVLSWVHCCCGAAAGTAELVNHRLVELSSLVLNDVTDLSASEYLALQDLYDATDGDSWAWDPARGTTWNFTDGSSPCLDLWEGIVCTPPEADGYLHIYNISLARMDLLGSLPQSIGNFPYLDSLDLSYNFLTGGGIPDSIGQLYNLHTLQLALTQFTGYNEDVLGSMTNLTFLDFSYNYLSGTFPEALCNLTSLSTFNFVVNILYNELPDCFGSMGQLSVFNIEANFLSGYIPPSFGDCTQLTQLILSSNILSGPLPTTLQHLDNLQYLAVTDNFLSGTIPTYIGNSAQLISLDLSINSFTGTLPDTLYSLVHLEKLTLLDNAFNGSLSNAVGNLTQLVQLAIDNNAFTGTLPTSIRNSTQLAYLSCVNNALTGTLPAEWSTLSQLSVLQLSHNSISGTIPPEWGNLTFMNFVFADQNYISGTIPPTFLSITSLRVLELPMNLISGSIPSQAAHTHAQLLDLSLGVNRITGSIPANISTYSKLAGLNLTNNYITGSIPDTITTLPVLNYLYLSSNKIVSDIPQAISQMKLDFLYLDNNYLHGTIPAQMNELYLLQSLNLSYNLVSGTIPLFLSQMTTLEVLLLHHNFLEGSLSGLCAYTTNTSLPTNTVLSATSNVSTIEDSKLVTLQVGGNSLTGTLPDTLHLLANLEVFSAVSNCFTGSLPTSLCLSYSLNTLALDGLQSAPACQHKLFPSSLDGIVAKGLYSIRSPLTGGLPACLFQMGNLTTLHLSGNGLTGTLPSSDGSADSYITPTLTDLSLSHNKLSGSIPSALLGRRWTNLDLSYNRFTRGLRLNSTDSYPANASVALEQNRLSGRIPHALSSVAVISVLEGNLFSCDARESGVPTRDEYYDRYQCGSDTLNETLYAWIVLVFVLVLVCGALWWYNHREVESRAKTVAAQMRVWWDASVLHDTSLLHYQEVRSATTTIARVATVATLWCLLVLMPMYITMSAYYGTYTHQYAWALSAAYLSGTVPFALEFALLVLLVCSSTALYLWLHARGSDTVSNGVDRVVSAASSTTADVGPPALLSRNTKRLIVQFVFVLLNFVVVGGVNIAYVVIALNENGNALTLTQFALALFKVAFNSVCAPVLLRRISMRVLGDVQSKDFVSIQLFVSLVNNILIPCFVVAVVSPSCFYNIFKTAKSVHASFTYKGKCLYYSPAAGGLVACSAQEILKATTAYDPPFAYSYQCSSSFITYYAPAYVIMCILAGFAIPVVQVSLKYLHSRAVPGTRWFRVLDAVLPRIWKPLPSDTPDKLERDVFMPFFDASRYLTTVLTYLGLLMTFGAVFPPLAVCFLCTIVLMITFTNLKVGRFVSHVRDKNAPIYLAIVNEECEGVCEYQKSRKSILFIAVTSLLFYTLFLFDTLGDSVGVEKAYWVLIVVPLMSVVIMGMYLFSARAEKAPKEFSVDVRESSLELSDVAAHSTSSPIHSV